MGLVIGTDGSRVYTVEGNSGDACKIKSYPLDLSLIHISSISSVSVKVYCLSKTRFSSACALWGV